MTCWTSARRCSFALALALGALSAAPSGAAVFYVGLGTGCTHGNVSAAVAAAAANGPNLDFIRIASPTLFLNSLVEVIDQTVFLVGGFPNCTTSTPTGRTTLNRIGATEAFWVHGATLERTFGLTNIDVVMGSSAGRALTLQGLNNVVLDNSTLQGGQAANGGNVAMDGNVFLEIGNGSQVRDGAATSGDGGGIHCVNGGTIYVVDDSVIQLNSAVGDGGGIFTDNCSLIVEDSEVSDNSGTRGGGIFASNDSDVVLRGRRPSVTTNYTRLVSNSATDDGGGLVIWESSGTATNTHILDNSSGADGGGVHVYGNSLFFMYADESTCSGGLACSRLEGNAGLSTGGIGVFGASSAFLRQTSVAGNYATGTGIGSASAAAAANAYLEIESCVLRGNRPPTVGATDVTRVGAFFLADVVFSYSTVLEETSAPGVGVFYGAPGDKLPAGHIFVYDSIVQASRTFSATSIADDIECVVAAETASFPTPGTFVTTVVNPSLLFVNPATNDLRLKRFSVAQDYCTAPASPPRDYEDQVRGYDDPSQGDLFGAFDTGADEWRPDLFADGFETGSTLRWSSETF